MRQDSASARPKDPQDPVASRRGATGVRTWQIFVLLASGHVILAVLLNRWALPDATPHAPGVGAPSGDGVDADISEWRRWELWSYALHPLGLFVRIVGASLLVQLALLCSWIQVPLRTVIRACTWAHFVLLLGAGFQVLWIGASFDGQAAVEGMAVLPGSLAALFPQLAAGPAVELLLRKVTVFDLAWCALFILALEDGARIRFPAAIGSVLVVWTLLTVVQWSALLYLTGI